MVMYEDDGVGNLSLNYEKMPAAKELLRDILEAPIEYGENFQNKKRGVKATKDTRLIVNAPNLTRNTMDAIIKAVGEKAGWKPVNEKSVFGFELPESAYSDQEELMRF